MDLEDPVSDGARGRLVAAAIVAVGGGLAAWAFLEPGKAWFAVVGLGFDIWGGLQVGLGLLAVERRHLEASQSGLVGAMAPEMGVMSAHDEAVEALRDRFRQVKRGAAWLAAGFALQIVAALPW